MRVATSLLSKSSLEVRNCTSEFSVTYSIYSAIKSVRYIMKMSFLILIMELLTTAMQYFFRRKMRRVPVK